MSVAPQRFPWRLDPKDPLAVARSYADERSGDSREGRDLLYWQGDLYRARGTHYEPFSRDALESWIYLWLEQQHGDTGQIRPTRRMVDEVVDALKAVLYCDVSSPPAWLWAVDREAPPANQLIACRNGLLDPLTRRLLPPTRAFFGVNALDLDYDPDAPAPTDWLMFLRGLWPDDQESIDSLQEWFGLLLTGETRHQKALLLVGPRRSGKGTVGRVLTALVGLANMTAPTLSGLGRPFGLESMIGKTLALMSDVRLGGRADVAEIAEAILRITGEDTVSVQRKHRPDFTARLRVRFVLLSNEVPALLDQSGALAGRFIVLRLTRSFFGTEDLGLTDRLLAELPRILLWALDGLDRLRERGYLLQPSSALEVVRQLETLASPIKSFAAERCVVGPGASVECSSLFDAWREWAREQGREHAGTKEIFGRNLAAAFPQVAVTRPRVNGERVRYYGGIRLRAQWEAAESDSDGWADSE